MSRSVTKFTSLSWAVIDTVYCNTKCRTQTVSTLGKRPFRVVTSRAIHKKNGLPSNDILRAISASIPSIFWTAPFHIAALDGCVPDCEHPSVSFWNVLPVSAVFTFRLIISFVWCWICNWWYNTVRWGRVEGISRLIATTTSCVHVSRKTSVRLWPSG